ncbi:hypothetical protein BJD55_gp010 [Gordonia phage Yvonnetastic]|uniref:Uncharacterized protein n=1 Tax=Gordonia phage Yvonnetastic TaxID=1821566 RepID=A0A142K8X6_9CAUD|nr:hypothetical protein BJD55_gp010 [Gordonia phage Yvonnetastic]AMS02559.1 hypothetical protein SEA_YVONNETASTIC_10 [Gordonia phage Yvonnetastic]WKW85990.1 membrane protein [Gordonia Phage JonJames]
MGLNKTNADTSRLLVWILLIGLMATVVWSCMSWREEALRFERECRSAGGISAYEHGETVCIVNGKKIHLEGLGE